ncbi:MAG: serine/threonine-protein kinase [Gemmatimonadetes bacterium]|nr:serine/threonine-protein kinase [Gemmatimonadota bacterium]
MTGFLDRLRAALADRYALERELGRGGMATVYLAEDLKHERKVAIKVLHPELAAILGAERFLQEIKVTANLQHPNILPLYDSGDAPGLVYYVMPYVAGESLRQKLNREHQLSVEETVTIATAVAGALQYAHEHGIIHRDIKPENILLTRGQPMIADFGIALAVSQAGGGRLTETGLSLGTPLYMSPEQAVGERQLDARSDVYSLAATVFEMLVGEPPYVGQSAQVIIARILSDPPARPTRFRPLIPPNVDASVRRALAKNPADRFSSASKFAEALANPAFRIPEPAAEAPPGKVAQSRLVLRTVAVLLAVTGALSVGWTLYHSPQPGPPSPLQLTVPLPAGVSLPMETGHPVLALSPDGNQLVFVGEEKGVRRLFRRALAQRNAEVIPETEGAAAPFFSPDGAWIAFLDGNTLKKVALGGGVPVPVAAVVGAEVNQGATWMTADTIVVATSPNSGLAAAAISNDHVGLLTDWKRITTDSTAPYARPHAVSGTPYVLFTENRSDSPDKASVSLLDRDQQSVRTIVAGGANPLYAPPNHLLFLRGRTLYASEVDLRRTGAVPEHRVLDSVITEPTGAGHVVVSRNGSLAYVLGPPVPSEHELVWVRRDGSVVPLFSNGRPFSFPRLSPDGSRLTLTSPLGANFDVYVLALNRLALDRITTDPGEDFGGIWNPDGSGLAFSSEQFYPSEGPHAAWQRGPEDRLEILMRTPPDVDQRRASWDFPTSWSPDGKWIAYTRERNGMADVEVIPSAAPGTSRPFASNPSVREFGAAFSPDSRVLAYVSDESGNDEVYVQSFPGPERRVRISSDGGAEPLWNRTGRELFYRHGDELLSVRFDNDSPLQPRKPTLLFTGHFNRVPYGGEQANYDVSPDGSRFVFVRRKNLPHPTVIHVVINWPEAFRSQTASR